MKCLICNSRTKELVVKSRILKYYCEDCDMIFVIRAYKKYQENESLVMCLSTSQKYFILRKKKDYDPGISLKTVINQR